MPLRGSMYTGSCFCVSAFSKSRSYSCRLSSLFSFEDSDMCWTFAKMSGKPRTLWRGSLELSEDEELDIAIATHQPSLRGQETFDWKIKNDEVCLTFEEIWNWQRISGQFSSTAPELSFQTKRLEDVPPGKLTGWGAIMFICMISSQFCSIS